MSAPTRRKRGDSSSHRIAANMKSIRGAARGRTRGTSVSSTGVRPGTVVGTYEIESTSPRLPNQTLTAAAELVFGKSVAGTPAKRPPAQPWQDEAWELRKEIGEFRFAGDRTARALSLCRLFVAKKVDGQTMPEPLDADANPAIAAAVEPLFGSIAKLEQAMKRVGQHLNFNGESLLVISQEDDGTLTMTPASTTEITGTGDTMKLDDGVNKRDLRVETDLVIRCYTPDPQKGGLPDCAAQAVLPAARELRGLTQHTSAQIDSRLAGAGILIVPNDIEVLSGQGVVELERDEDGVPIPGQDLEDGEFHPFVEALVESMTVPISNRDSAAALVPLVVKCHPDSIDKIKRLTFENLLDPMAKDLREEAIRRIALGMDSPPEVLLGMGSANHWSAWQVGEEEITLVVAPLAATVCHALTVHWLIPALEQLGVEGAGDYQIWFDTTRLQLRPDKSGDAKELYDRGALSLEALLRENGFDADDLPSPEEQERNLLIGLLKGAPSGEMARLLLPLLGVEIPPEALAQAVEIGQATGGTPAPTNEAPVDDTAAPADTPAGERTPPERDTTPPSPEVEAP